MYHIIINPASRSGKGISKWHELEPVLREEKVKYKAYFTKRTEPCKDIVQEIWDSRTDKDAEVKVIILGGDGTVNEFLQVACDFEHLRLTVLPTGSSNDFARSMGINFDARQALKEMLTLKREVRMDLGKVNATNSVTGAASTRRFLEAVGFGYDAEVCVEVDESKIKPVLNKVGMGKLVYLGVALKQLAKSPVLAGKLTLDDGTVIDLDKLIFVVGMNNIYEGGGFKFAPDAKYDDGLLDVCLAAGISKPRVLRVLPTAFKGNHLKYEGVSLYRTSSYTLDASMPMAVHTDGEAKMTADHIEVSIEKQMLRLVY